MNSPMPSTMAGAASRKKGTSAPSCKAKGKSSSVVKRKSHKALRDTNVVAASLEPPPSPAPLGITLPSSISTPNSGLDTCSFNKRAALTTKSSSSAIPSMTFRRRTKPEEF